MNNLDWADRSRGSKAARLVAEGKVQEVVGARAFLVEGTSSTYLVTLAGEAGRCDCPARVSDCSHVIACRAIVERDRRGNL